MTSFLKTSLIIFFLFLFGQANGQSAIQQQIDSLEKELVKLNNDSAKLKIIPRLIVSYLPTSNRDRTWELIDLLGSLSKKTNNHVHYTGSLFYAGIVHFSLNKDGQLGLKYFKEALDYYNKNQVKKPRLQRSLYNNIGLIYKNFEAYDSAIFYYRNGMEIEMAQTPDIIITDNINLSRLNISMGNYYKAFEHAQKSLDLSLESGDKEQIFVGYRTVGETYLAIGSNELALDYLTRALNVSIELNGFDDVDTYYLYHAVGKCYVGMKEYNYGKKYYLKYLDYLIKLHGLNHPKLTPVYHDLGAAYQKSAEYDSATYFFNQAISSANKKTSLFNIWRFHSLRELGNIEMERGNFNKAMVHLDAALQLKSADSSRNSSVWRLIGKTHFLRGQYQKSLNYYQRALNLTSIHTNGATANPDVGSINRKRTAIGILIDKAEAQTAIWRQSKSKAKNNLMSALSTYLSCDTLILNIRDLYRVESDVLTFNENTKRLYSGAVEVCFNLYQITADQRYFDLGFYFSERSKSSVLTSALASQTAIKYSGISDSLIEREAQLKSSLRFINSKYNKAVAERDTNRVQELKDRLFDLNSEYNKYVSYLEKNFSKYFNLKYNTWQISTSDIQRNLNNQCLIEYVDVNDSTIYAFILNKGIQSLVKIEKPREFDEWIDEFQDVFSHQQYESYQRVAYNLYRVLIDVLPDVVSESSDLIIVPDGNLWRINFEVLLTERSTQANFSDLPYLLKTKAISYANSANLLFGVGQRKNTPQLKECIAFSYSDSSKVQTPQTLSFNVVRDNKMDLPGSRREITNIAKYIPGVYYFGASASELSFKKVANKYSILHLALHGEVSDENPNLSNLIFSENAMDSLEDNRLYSNELYNMELNAEMAVLSACNTGAGRLRKGEGIISLGRAFQYAGVKSIVLSDWEVADDTAPVLMEYFYSNLKSGMTKSEALRQAKLKYLADDHTYSSAPFYWGNFRVIGDPSRLDFGYDYTHVTILLLTVFLTFFILLASVERQKVRLR